ncbi:MAG: hypothetical protein RLY71_1268 [Pseudomonadota bacterium]|jgi:uncharacterized protein (TIGR00730 family)
MGESPQYRRAAEELGRQIGARGWRLVYGGGNVGLMGVVADAVLKAGGSVLGIIPESLMRREVGHLGLTELQVVQTMHERKQRMTESADAFIALPGGIGTLEELYEVWTWQHLGYHDKPVALLDVAGYYQHLLAFMRHAEQEGFVSPDQQAVLWVESDPARLLDHLAQHIKPLTSPAGGDYRRI